MPARAQEAAPPDTAPGPAGSESDPWTSPYVWDLTDLYPDTAAWRSEFDRVRRQTGDLVALQGIVDKNPEAFLSVADRISTTYKDAVRLLVYATLDADTRLADAAAQERRRLARDLIAEFNAAVSWFDPKLLSMGQRKITRFLSRETGLEKHRFALENTLRVAPHRLGTQAEKVIAEAAGLATEPREIYAALTATDLPWPELRLSRRETIRVDPVAYRIHGRSSKRDRRRAVFEAHWGTWKAYEATLGSILHAHFQGLDMRTRQRGHVSSLERVLFQDNLPAGVADTLLAVGEGIQPALHRALRLRARMLNIRGPLKFYDLYAPLAGLDVSFSIEDSIALARQALVPLGPEFRAVFAEGLEGRWMHVFPGEGKRGGAYMFGGAYDVHPYLFLNHTDDFESLLTFTHEYTHAVHAALASRSQPWETASPPVLVSETAAMTAELLLQDSLIEKAETREEKLFYLAKAVDSLRSTYVRQAMLAAFERTLSETVARGGVITGVRASSAYLELLRGTYGQDEGIVDVEPTYGVSWAAVPHLFYDNYVFQYAAAFAAGAQLADRIRTGEEGAADAYLALLKAGGSDYPYALLKEAGVDLASPVPYRAVEARMIRLLDAMEAALAMRG
ncbi:MAG: M3 family oligoendopeptidase [Alphaproteobacteria bacterium]